MNRNRLTRISATALVSVALIGAVAPAANAATSETFASSKGTQCIVEGARSVVHPAVTHPERVVTPGKKAVDHLEERWGRDIPAVTHDETQFSYEVPAVIEISYNRWMYSKVITGKDEVAYHVYQFSRTNPGQSETSTNYYKFSQLVKGTEGIKTYEWKTSVDDFKVKYQYQKQVKGVVQQWSPYRGWQNVDTFDWEWYSSPSYQSSFNDVAVLESGGHNSVQKVWTDEKGNSFRKVTQAYQYVKNGVTEKVKTGSHWEYQWSVNSPGNGWTKTGKEDWATKPTADQTIYYNNGDWVTNNPGAPWVQYDSKTEGNDDAVAPFTEYLAQDGSATPDKGAAGTFKEESFDGWTQFSKKWYVEQEKIDDKTVYLVRDDEGSLVFSDNKADASWFTSKDEVDETGLTRFGTEKYEEVKGEDAYTVYLTLDDGVVGETTDASKASWVTIGDPVVDIAKWQRVLDEDNEPVSRTVTDKDGYTEYYVPGAEPTRELGDSNWSTKDEMPTEGGWEFIDRKTVEDEAAVPEVVTIITITDKGAWTEQIAAKTVPCAPAALATTGGEVNGGALAVGAGAVLLGGALLTRRMLRNLREANAVDGPGSSGI